MDDQKVWEGTNPPKCSEAYKKAAKLCKLERHTETLFIPITNRLARENLKRIGGGSPEKMFQFAERVLSLPPSILEMALSMIIATSAEGTQDVAVRDDKEE